MIKAGFSRVDVTPPLGAHLAGYYQDRIAKGILDPIYLNAIAFSDDNETVVWVTADFLNIRMENCNEIRTHIAKRLGIKTKNVMVSCLHQHTSIILASRTGDTSIYTDHSYIDLLIRKFCDVAEMAVNDMKEATMFVGEQEAAEKIAFIRRYLMKDGTIVTNPGRGKQDLIERPLDDSDNTIRLIRFKREDGDIALVNFSTHPDVIGGEYYSADWPGFVRTNVEREIEGSRCIVINGVEGDSNHLNFQSENIPRKGTAHSKFMARVITDAVHKIWNDAKEVKVEKLVSKTDIVYSKTRIDGIERYDECCKFWDDYYAGKITDPKEMKKIADAGRVKSLLAAPIYQRLPLSTVDFGKVAIVGFGGEPFTHYATSVREACPDKYIIAACCTNGGEGYLPTAKALKEGGYEADRSLFTEVLEGEYVEMAKKMLEE